MKRGAEFTLRPTDKDQKIYQGIKIYAFDNSESKTKPSSYPTTHDDASQASQHVKQ